MDRILLKDIKLYGYHGVYQEERQTGQYFHIDVDISVDLKQAGITDDIINTVDYSKIYDIIKRINENNKFRLIESFAHNISQEMLSTYEEIKDITVQIRKPDAPIDGDFGWVGVEIKRSRDNA
ncbi:dihydroneopterin aldolase [Acetivibrio cellulolyticus]|uniref:dihydroneopterin aldolase n=1 Tax=Acetivibrio cellulolyticus TaxID=35830 RepID=UPI0001E2DEDC|nr:dihydroneopterin aldolase [Acetivibrio cellulolyticus]